MTTHIGIHGPGYLDATHATGMANSTTTRLASTSMWPNSRRAKIPLYEPERREALQHNIAAGRLRFTSSFEEAAAFATHISLRSARIRGQGEFAADVRHVDAVIETLAPLLTELTVIFGKSTVPVGTAKRVGARARELAPAGDDVEVAWNPEFLREGFAMRDTLHPVVRSRAIIYGRNCFGPHQW